MDSPAIEQKVSNPNTLHSVDRPLGARRASAFSFVEAGKPEADQKVSDRSIELFLSRLLPQPLHKYIESVKYDPTSYGSGETKMTNGYANIAIHPPEPSTQTILTPEDVYYLVAHETGHMIAHRLRNHSQPDLWNRWADAVRSNPKLVEYMNDAFPIGTYDQTVTSVADQMEELFGQVLAASSEKISNEIIGIKTPTQQSEGVFGDDPAALKFDEQIATQKKIMQELGRRATLPTLLDN